METLKTPEFVYFDLGKVLLDFSHDVMCQQMAKLVDCDGSRMRQIIFDEGLSQRYESGEIDSNEFCESVFSKVGTRCSNSELLLAGSDIFSTNTGMIPIVAQLGNSGIPIGILSNTCEAHWNFVVNRFRFLSDSFSEIILSYEVGAMKPAPLIYNSAAEKAGVEPESIFFVDDRQENVDGAIAAGLDAHLFCSPHQVAQLLMERGVRFNY